MKISIGKLTRKHRYKPYTLFVILALVFGTFFALLVPPFWGADESTHFARVYDISEGHPLPRPVSTGGYGNQQPANLVELLKYSLNDVENIQTQKPFYDRNDIDNDNMYKTYESQKFSAQQAEHDFTGAAGSFPAAYAGPLTGTLFARALHLNIGQTLTAARLLNLLTYVILVAAALLILRNSKWAWPMFIIGLFPMAIFQASIVSVDPLSTGLVFIFFSLLITVWAKKTIITKWEILAFLFLAAAIPLTKQPYFILLLPLLLLPHKKWTLKKHSYIFKVSFFALLVTPMLAWVQIIKDISVAGLSSLRGSEIASQVSTSGQIKYIITHPLDFTEVFFQSIVQFDGYWVGGIFGLLGWNVVGLSSILVLLLASALVLATFYAKEDNIKEKNLVRNLSILFCSVGCVVFTIVIFYLVYTPVGYDLIEGVQGRYFIPAIPFIVYGIGKIVPIRVLMSERAATVLFSSVAMIGLLGSLLIYRAVL